MKCEIIDLRQTGQPIHFTAGKYVYYPSGFKNYTQAVKPGYFNMKRNRLTRHYSSPFEWDFLEDSGDVFLICIPILLLLMISLRFAFSGYWEDEIFSITTARSWSDMFFVFRNYENNMSLYYVILHAWMKLFGESEIAVHSLSLLFAVLTIPVFYKLERNWLNKSTSMMGGLLLAANPLYLLCGGSEKLFFIDTGCICFDADLCPPP